MKPLILQPRLEEPLFLPGSDGWMCHPGETDFMPVDKTWGILELEPPRTVKAVQSLNGKVAALNRFVSKVTDKCLPFF